MKTILAVALGGAIGSVLRLLMNNGVAKATGDALPWGIFAINVLGSFLIGLLIAIFAHFWQPSQEIRAFLVTGICGGFTTFSSFSLDFANLWQRGDMALAVGYAVSSVVISILALFLAMFLVRSVAP